MGATWAKVYNVTSQNLTVNGVTVKPNEYVFSTLTSVIRNPSDANEALASITDLNNHCTPSNSNQKNGWFIQAMEQTPDGPGQPKSPISQIR